MLVPFADWPGPRRMRLAIALVITAAACMVVLSIVLPPAAQPCVLYAQSAMPMAPWHDMPMALLRLSNSFEAARLCLATTLLGRELATTLIDNVLALSYGAGASLLLLALARSTPSGRPLPRFLADMLLFAAACFPVAAAFDLVENQVTIAARIQGSQPLWISDALIFVARYCAIPKYALISVGLLLALLTGLLALLAWVQRRLASK